MSSVAGRTWAVVVLLLAMAGCNSSNSPGSNSPAANLDGVWLGTLPDGGTDQPALFVLKEQSDGRLMGYVLGGAKNDTVIAGPRTGNTLPISVEFRDPQQTRTVSMTAFLNANLSEFSGNATDGQNSGQAVFGRINLQLHERRFFFAQAGATPEDAQHLTRWTVVIDGQGNLLAGAYAGDSDCLMAGCRGVVTSFQESGNQVNIGFEFDQGSCRAQGQMNATFNTTTRNYEGFYSTSGCSPLQTNVPLIGVRTPGSRSDDVQGILNTMSALASELEQSNVLSNTDPLFAPGYQFAGLDRPGKIGELNVELATYSHRSVTFNRFRNATTVLPQHAWINGQFIPKIDFNDQRSGIPAQSAQPVTYKQDDTETGDQSLAFLNESNGAWVFSGDGVLIDIPFAGYRFGAESLILPSDGGDIHVSVGPWGKHTPALTGHVEGNVKADWVAYYAWTREELTELEGNGNGICEAGETCGYPGADLLSRAVVYAAPDDDFVVDKVWLSDVSAPNYSSGHHWQLTGRVGRYGFLIGHLRKIAPGLRDAMMAAGYVDPWTVNTVTANLITGAPVTLARHASIGYAQINAQEVAGHPGFFTALNNPGASPWQFVEFNTYNTDTGRLEPIYRWLSSSKQDSFRQVLYGSAQRPIARFDNPYVHDWQWKSEMELYSVDGMSMDDYSGLFSRLGGWFENDTNPCNLAPACDETFSIWAIDKNTPFYSAGLYSSANVNYLVGHQKGVPSVVVFGEVITPSVVDPISGTLLVRWRQNNGAYLDYQRISYRVDTPGRKLRIAWGPMSPSDAGAMAPPVPDNSAVCDGETLTCHTH